MNGQGVPPQFVVQTGIGFVLMVSTLELTDDPHEAISLSMREAQAVISRLRITGFDAKAVPVARAIRAFAVRRCAMAVLIAIIALCALLAAWKAARASYKIAIADPPQVCTVPDTGIVIDASPRFGSLAGHRASDVIFADGFQHGGAPR